MSSDDTTLPDFAREPWAEQPEPPTRRPSRQEPEGEGPQIEDVIVSTHQGVQALQALLEPREQEESPIDQIVGLLEQIVLGQRHLGHALETMENKINVIGNKLGIKHWGRVSLAISDDTATPSSD